MNVVILIAAVAVTAFLAGRMSAARAIRHLREALDWRIRIGEGRSEPRPRRALTRRKRKDNPQ